MSVLGAVQRANTERIFAACDVGQDGVVDGSDFEVLAGRVRSMREGIPAAVQQQVTDAYAAWWQQIRAGADADGDGAVTLEDFAAAVEARMARDPGYAEALSNAADAVFTAVDADGDGMVDRWELGHFYHVCRVPQEYADEAFARIDRDGDGEISHKEYVQYVRETYLSDDPDNPGTWMFGPPA